MISSKKLFSLFVVMLLSLTTIFAQQTQEVEMADVMRSNGKIYVVVTCILILFVGIIIYLITLDRKINKIEKSLNEK